MERETGIEPATNSLEGCDSTTELLPPTRSLPIPYRPLTRLTRFLLLPSACSFPFTGLQPGSRSEGRLVAREGLEPSKPLGRQIYSLLRLTASLPRQLFVESVYFDACLADRNAHVVGAGEGI